MALLDKSVPEQLPPVLDATAEQPPLFDGTTRLYTAYTCPFAQRVWITRNYKGLQDKIHLVPLNLQNRPSWYGEKVYSVNKDPAKKELAEELFSYTDKFNTTVFTSFKGDVAKESGPAFDYLENALHKFDDGPFLLGQFSLVDIAYIPFVERFQIFLSEVFKYDTTAGRPKLAAWIEEMNKIGAYKQTKTDPKQLVEFYKKRILGQ
ncbi:glutathione S-transferase L3 isoform X2 [Manihot esculenta]|uniref:glutathione S-transferase L3 isoform X2 n=1 Tax=Manihot esculenta TaxID=3983 RepID=UPI000B5D165E|nr:glutathione S-transferase L3 isoform X2 [Manihot esculenta]